MKICISLKLTLTKGDTLKVFSVWVGGIEVNDSYLTYQEADSLAKEYLDQDYDDVQISMSYPATIMESTTKDGKW